MIVVEGYMDVIGLAGAGIEEVVAPLGTALTEAQLERLWRLDPAPILCFDGDGAGQKAAIRAAARALPFLAPGRTLRFVTLPAGQDPDDLVRSGGRQAMDMLLDAPEPLVERLWRHERDALPLDTPEARAGLKQRLAEHARAIGDSEVSRQYLSAFRERADALFIPARREWTPRNPPRPGRMSDRRGGWQPPPPPVSEAAKAMSRTGIDTSTARAILIGLIRLPDCLPIHAEALSRLHFGDGMLDRTRSALVEAAWRGETLEGEVLGTILRRVGAGELIDGTRTNRLVFSFQHGDANPERARRDLGEIIDVMVRRSELDAALAEATARFEDTSDEAGWEHQRHLMDERQATDQRLVELRQAASDTEQQGNS